MSPPQAMIELRRLFRFFGETRAVNDVSFTVAPGEVLGFIGPNGAGKTTTMRILSTLDLPSHGDAFVDGFSVVNDPDRVRLRLGFMPDFFGTYPNVNCWEYLDFFARSYGLSGAARRHAVRHTLSFTGLDALLEKPVRALSKGMKQRLCLGRAMIHDPAALILDEPAAGLDPRARIELRRMIRELAAAGKALLVSSHILSELAEMCDQVAIIEQGQILAMGSVDEVLHGQNTRRTIQVRALEHVEKLVGWLAARELLSDVVADGDVVTFGHPGDRQQEAALLRELVQAGFEISEFSSQKKSLEDVFMRVTTGAVQ